jgi:hypothetical protein
LNVSSTHLIVLILLSHGLLLRLSLALVAVILKPNFHLKQVESVSEQHQLIEKFVN